MKYVLATPDALRAHFAPFSRLYAYPTAPDAPAPGEITILDSGAYGLSMQGKSIDARHMRNLSPHYAAHHAERVFCVAPDVYLDPRQTQRNWARWHDAELFSPVCPVIQSNAKGDFPFAIALQQIQFYRKEALHYRDFTGFPAVFVSNPGMTAAVARTRGLRRLLDTVRGEFAAPWIHVLGAGWNFADVQGWASLGGFDSLDSVAPCTAARQGESWDGQTYPDWKTRAAANAVIANQIFSCAS